MRATRPVSEGQALWPRLHRMRHGPNCSLPVISGSRGRHGRSTCMVERASASDPVQWTPATSPSLCAKQPHRHHMHQGQGTAHSVSTTASGCLTRTVPNARLSFRPPLAPMCCRAALCAAARPAAPHAQCCPLDAPASTAPCTTANISLTRAQHPPFLPSATV